MTDAGLHHLAVFYEDAASVAECIAQTIEHDTRDGTAVLVCLPDTLAQHVARCCGSRDNLTFLPADSRYARPIQAMRDLWDFMTRALESGAPRVHSIGQIGFSGSATDVDWHWYERAANDVFADLPLTATCLFDLNQLSPSNIERAMATHPVVEGDVPRHGAVPHDCDLESLVPSPLAVPTRPVDLSVDDLTDPASARRALRQVLDGGHQHLADRAQVIVSELVTNAILHGHGHASLRCWTDDAGLTLQVSDDGPGIDDPFASLRPPALPVRGAGLWISHLEATQLSVARRDPHGTVVTARID